MENIYEKRHGLQETAKRPLPVAGYTRNITRTVKTSSLGIEEADPMDKRSRRVIRLKYIGWGHRIARQAARLGLGISRLRVGASFDNHKAG